MNPLALQLWAMTPEAHRLLLDIAAREMTPVRLEALERALSARAGQPLENSYEVAVRDGVAILPMYGPLFRHANLLTSVSGATSYQFLARDFTAALDDPTVRSIVLDVDSPGGEVNGCAELAGLIYQARGRKPIAAYIGGAGTSGAYWIASAADEIVCAQTALLGSLGVVSVYVDEAKAEEMAGLKTIEIVSSQSPYKRLEPTTDDGRARLQRRVDALADVFLRDVARHRGVALEVVAEQYGRGDILVGQAAVAAGLADRLGTLEQLLAGRFARRSSIPVPGVVTAAPTEIDMGKCSDCGIEMGPDDSSYCSACKGGASTASALGLPAGASVEQMTARATALAGLEARIFALTGTTSAEEAIGRIAAGAEALRDSQALRQDLAKVQAAERRRELRAVLERGLGERRLSLGAIQMTIPLFVLDEGKQGAMRAAFQSLSTVTREAVLDAACSIDLDEASLRAISAYARTAPPTVAEPFREAARSANMESADLDAQSERVIAAAREAREILDRNKPAATAAK